MGTGVCKKRVRLNEEWLHRRLILGMLVTEHFTSAHLVLEQCREVQHLLRKAVEWLGDARLEVPQTLVSRRHVLVVVGQVCVVSCILADFQSVPSSRFLLRATSFSIWPIPSSNRSSPSFISTNRPSGLRTRVKALTIESLRDSSKEVWDSGGGCARWECLATFWSSEVEGTVRHTHWWLWRKSATIWLRWRVGWFAMRSAKRCRLGS